jgi:hypothetical protein
MEQDSTAGRAASGLARKGQGRRKEASRKEASRKEASRKEAPVAALDTSMRTFSVSWDRQMWVRARISSH